MQPSFKETLRLLAGPAHLVEGAHEAVQALEAVAVVGLGTAQALIPQLLRNMLVQSRLDFCLIAGKADLGPAYIPSSSVQCFLSQRSREGMHAAASRLRQPCGQFASLPNQIMHPVPS